jgi:hypothetical protein
MRATADQQPTLVASEIAVKVATQKKTEMITLAEGNAEAKALEGTGEGKRLIAIGDGEASKIAAIGEATAQAYSKQQEAIGEEAIKQIKIVELIATAIDHGKIKVVPDVLVTGGGHAAGLERVAADLGLDDRVGEGRTLDLLAVADIHGGPGDLGLVGGEIETDVKKARLRGLS